MTCSNINKPKQAQHIANKPIMKKLLLAHKRFSQNSQPNVCAFKNIHVIIYYYYLST